MPNVERTLIALAIVSHVGVLVVGVLIWGALVTFTKKINELGNAAMVKAMDAQGDETRRRAERLGVVKCPLHGDLHHESEPCPGCIAETEAFAARSCDDCNNGTEQRPSGSTCSSCGRYW